MATDLERDSVRANGVGRETCADELCVQRAQENGNAVQATVRGSRYAARVQHQGPCVQVSKGAAEAVSEGRKRVELSVLNAIRGQDDQPDSLSEDNCEEDAGDARRKDKSKDKRKDKSKDTEGAAAGKQPGWRDDWDSRMWTILRTEAARMLGTHSTETIWLFDPPERGNGLECMLTVMGIARGLQGLYSTGWLRQNKWRVSFLSVLELIGTPVERDAVMDADWTPWNFAMVYNTGSQGVDIDLQPGKAAGVRGWLRQCNRGLSSCDDNCLETCYSAGARADPLRRFEFGYAVVRSILYPWPETLEGFDNFMSAACYIEAVWQLAEWDLTDDKAHIKRVAAGMPPSAEQSRAYTGRPHRMSRYAWSVETQLRRRQETDPQPLPQQRAAHSKRK
eukprot:CAMPEP_0181344688 /NCGR_PEP_ID=MMETSP1101-20121128/32320_1 /TAXON_ID=46948 /ORGANISM="Rhodomonas abbreviata, Strain Caron Lab Isolate" /LENGTH=392 /DNA_ID=CAMNT_0023456535 /DNA_START=39 /DNA_END=1215 /DNA_ORIENTATION=-